MESKEDPTPDAWKMPIPDWTPGEYQDFRWELLRRNPDYKKDWNENKEVGLEIIRLYKEDDIPGWDNIPPGEQQKIYELSQKWGFVKLLLLDPDGPIPQGFRFRNLFGGGFMEMRSVGGSYLYQATFDVREDTESLVKRFRAALEGIKGKEGWSPGLGAIRGHKQHLEKLGELKVMRWLPKDPKKRRRRKEEILKAFDMKGQGKGYEEIGRELWPEKTPIQRKEKAKEAFCRAFELVFGVEYDYYLGKERLKPYLRDGHCGSCPDRETCENPCEQVERLISWGYRSQQEKLMN